MVTVKALSMLQPAPADAGEWALSRMRDRDGVALIVPGSFPAVVRIMHELSEDIGPEDGEYIPREVRWSDSLPELLAREESPWIDEEDLGSLNTMPGVLDRSIIAQLLPLLSAATTTPDTSLFGVWRGHGGLESDSRAVGIFWTTDDRPSRAEIRRQKRQLQVEMDRRTADTTAMLRRCPVVPWWGGRDAYLLQGPLDAIDSLGAADAFVDDRTDPLGPMWWWPQDRAWFIGNEIDDPWSYLAGPQSLIDQVLALSTDGALEACPVAFDSPW